MQSDFQVTKIYTEATTEWNLFEGTPGQVERPALMGPTPAVTGLMSADIILDRAQMKAHEIAGMNRGKMIVLFVAMPEQIDLVRFVAALTGALKGFRDMGAVVDLQVLEADGKMFCPVMTFRT